MRIPVIVSGCCGRMGKAISTCALGDKDIELVGAFEAPDHGSIGADIGSLLGMADTGVKVVGSLADIDVERAVIIEFTSVFATMEHLEWAANREFPIVIGTTGLSEGDLGLIEKTASKIPVLQAPNMSIGVNLLLKLVNDAAKTLGDEYDIEIVETHHRFKKDAPSGTAIKLAQVAAQALHRNLNKTGVYGRKGFTGERTQKEIGIHSVRSGDVVGDHTVSFATIGERIELTHKASSRDTFARGAIAAAKYMWNQSPGRLYTMHDVLGIKMDT